MGFSLSDCETAIATLAAVIAAIYTVLAYYRPPGPSGTSRTSRPFMIVLALVAWAAVALDALDRHYFSAPPASVFMSYGVAPNGFFAVVNAANTDQYRGRYKAYLIMRVIYIDIDRETDTNIDLSLPYTIEGSQVTLYVVLKPGFKMKISNTKPNMIEFNAVVIPADVSASKIASLSDVELHGGKVIGTSAQGLGPMILTAPAPQP